MKNQQYANEHEVASMLTAAIASGLIGAPLPKSAVRFSREQLLYINTVYDEARNRAKPSKSKVTS